MSTQKQIDANRQNAQNSHGPTTPEGQKRSSLNAVKHGLTGQTLVLSPGEEASYAQFVKEYFEDWQPFDVSTRQLTQVVWLQASREFLLTVVRYRARMPIRYGLN